MTCWALVALKAPAAAKGRLAEFLSADARNRLVSLMFDNVLTALREAQSLAGIAIVTSEPLMAADVTVIDDPGRGLNEALAHGANWLAARGVNELLLLHADLPLVRGAEIDAVVAAGRERGLAIAPDKHGQGTNALYIPLPQPFAFRFGVNSFHLHLAEAAGLGRPMAEVHAPGLAFDVDEPQDIERLLAQGGEIYRFLRPE